MGSSVSHETNYSINEDIKDGYSYYAKFKDDHFAEGACRWAFKGTLYGQGPRDNTPCVTKVFKNEVAKKMKDWHPDIAASKKALGFAKHFQSNYFWKIRNYTRDQEIEFLVPLIAVMKEISRFDLLWFIEVSKDERYVKERECVAIEPFIDGNYEKFNANGGYEDSFHSLMTAFCHWTWNISGHKYMVCDLQGVKSGRKYILTDPAIHSVGREFGNTDFGIVGMEKVLANHTCNTLCRELGLNNPVTGVYINPGPRSTTYSFQVTEQELMRADRGRSNYFTMLDPIFE